MPTTDEVRGWARLAAAVADRVVAGTVHDMHRAISDGAFRWVGPVGRPVHRVSTAVTDGVYGAVRASLRSAGKLCAAAAGHLGTDAVAATPAAVKARAIVNGVVGDDLIGLAPELDMEVTLRDGRREVAVDPAALASTYPDAGGRVALFLHGLVDTEAVWFGRPHDGAALPDVAAQLGVTPLLVRYSTGRAIGRNGADLAELIEALVAAWPVRVTELTLVGHSMGGLLARAACRTARERAHSWTQVLADIVYLGTPHFGSWLEKVANVGSWVLRRDSRSAPLGSLLDGRSQGIKDLRFGTLAEDGWGGHAVDDLLTGLAPDEPWLADVTHHLFVGRVRPSTRHPLSIAIGDSLVRSGSAAAHGRRRRIGDGGRVVVIPVDASHSRLISHPEVAGLLRAVLGRGDHPVDAANGHPNRAHRPAPT